MIRTIRAKLLLACSIVLCLILGVCIGNIFVNTAAEESETSLNTTYELNQSIQIPTYSFIVDGNSVDATEYSLEYPNGIVKAGTIHTLDIAGMYTVHYSAMVNGKVYAEKQTFSVINELYTHENQKSSVSYGVNENFPNAPEGLVLSIAANDKISFNKIIDLSNMTKLDQLLSFYITPTEIGTFDAANITFRFTDVYDSNNYMDVTYRCLYGVRTWAQQLTYTVAQTTGNPTVGGTYIGDMWGYPTYQTFCGVVTWGHEVGEDPYNLYFDYNTRQVWNHHNSANASFNGTYIADLDDPTIFTNPWDGFTTGEVYLSVFATSYNAPTANIVLTQLEGYDLTETKFVDEAAPQINVDMAGNLVPPDGRKGVAYQLFNATALDAYDGAVEVNTYVYYKYGTLAQVDVYNKDGYFYPTQAGTYTIVYTAKDSFGNKAVETMDVQILNDEQGLDFTIVEPVAEGVAGTDITAFESLNIQNQKGNIKIEIKAIYQNETLILGENYTFKPLYAGKYKLEVTVADYIETVVKSFDIEVMANTQPVFVDEVVLNAYFINGQTYKLPIHNGYDISSGTPKTIPAKVLIVEDAGVEKEVGGEEFIVEAEEIVTVIYRISVNGTTVDKTYSINVIQPINEDWNCDVSQYYYTTKGNGSVVVDRDFLRFSATEDSTVQFVNAVQVEDFITKFQWSDDKVEFEGVNIYFTDKENRDIRVKVTYTYVEQLGFISINGGKALQVPLNTGSTDRKTLTLGYINDQKQMYGHISLMMNVTETMYGETFNGFPSNMVYIEYELFGVTGEAELYITRINHQAMFDFQAEDSIEPEIFTVRSNGDVALGENVMIHGARAYDVLSNSVKLTLSVQAPDGSFVVANDGTKLDGTCDPAKNYIIKAAQYGTYTIRFVATDEAGNRNRYSYGFAVIDKESPMIAVDTKTVTAIKGSTVKVKAYEVVDNIDKATDLNVAVYVLKPGYVFEVVKDGQFVAVGSGTYTVYYYCYDSLNNMVIASYQVEVK